MKKVNMRVREASKGLRPPGSWFVRKMADARQRFFPEEIRIEPSYLPDVLRDALVQLGEASSASEARTADAPQAPRPQQALLAKPLADLGTHLWRLRGRMVVDETGEPRQEVRTPYRYLLSAWEDLKDLGIEIQDHTRCDYAPGMALKVLAFEPQEGITRDIVVETIKPSIYFQGKAIQMGEVIVAIPKGDVDRDIAPGST
jgi:hypothetical protein